MSKPAPRIDFTRSSNAWCLYAAIMLAACVLLLNPLDLALVIRMSTTRTAYVLFFDAFLVAIIIFCFRYLRWGQKRDGILAIALATLLPVAMILIEPAIIAVREAYQPATEPKTTVHQPDPLLGWSLVPGAHARHVSGGNFDATYVIDAKGRKEIPTHPGATRTLHFFGDSFLFGEGVSNDQTALNLVAGALGDRANVENYGVMAYGLEQMFVRLRESKEEIQPGDVVIFAPIAADLDRNLISKFFVCRIYAENYFPAQTFPLLDHGVWRTVPIHEYCPEGDLPIAVVQRFLARRPALEQDLAANADAIFAMAAALAKERGATFFVLFLVSADECHDGTFRYGHPELLKTSFTSLLPLCPENPSRLRFATDEHPNAEGQRWLAAGILDFLERDVLSAH